jgi:aromatic ring-opening dioxygenase catalytic subunit (LigB family)
MIDSSRLPTLFVPHGGGPCFFIEPADIPPGVPKDLWHPMEKYLRGVDATVGKRPKAAVVVSAHWMTPHATIGNAARHELYYDYYGFPAYTYALDYKPQGAPDVAGRVAELLGQAGIKSDMDDKRGIDHGVFVPLMLIYPDADVPIVPLSLRQDLDPAAHIAIGAALEKLRDEDVLIIATGMSFHNMRALRNPSAGGESRVFDDWLGAAVESPNAADRNQALANWQSAPGARFAHPQEEHLIPLMVAAGAAGEDRGHRNFSVPLGEIAMSGFIFGEDRK